MGYAEANGFVAVEGEDGSVVFGAQLGVSDVFQADEGAVRAGLENDIFEFGWFAKTADGANADLKSLSHRHGRLTNLASGDLDVLLLQRVEHVRRRQAALSHASRIEPQAHGVFAFAENEHIANAWDPLDGISDVQIDVIADE